MVGLSIKNIIKCTNGIGYNTNLIMDKEVNNISIDSRNVKAGGMFIAIKGEKVDGHSFIKSVMDNNALVCISEYDIDDADFPYIKVDSSLKALKDIAGFYRQQLNCKFIGITGSVGKTSTKEIIATILSEKFKVSKTKGNFNNEIGVPLTIFDIGENIEVAVVEMGINHFGEMTELARIVRPDICVITNIGDCHLEFLGDRSGVYKAKSEMLDYLNSNDSSIIYNGDDGLLDEIKEYNNNKIYKFYRNIDKVNKIKNDNIYNAYATDIVNDGVNGTSCCLHLNNKTINVQLSVPGEHMISNMLAGAMVAQLLGMSIDEIGLGINNIDVLSGRGSIIKTDNLTIYDGSYNSNPASLRASIDVLKLDPNRKIAIIGDMGELGSDTIMLHENIGKYLLKSSIDICVFIGKLSKNIYDVYCQKSSNKSFYFETVDEFIKLKKDIIKDGDSVLVKASHFMNFDKIVKELTK